MLVETLSDFAPTDAECWLSVWKENPEPFSPSLCRREKDRVRERACQIGLYTLYFPLYFLFIASPCYSLAFFMSSSLACRSMLVGSNMHSYIYTNAKFKSPATITITTTLVLIMLLFLRQLLLLHTYTHNMHVATGWKLVELTQAKSIDFQGKKTLYYYHY